MNGPRDEELKESAPKRKLASNMNSKYHIVKKKIRAVVETNDSCGRIQATGKEKRIFAMLIDVGTICLIL